MWALTIGTQVYRFSNINKLCWRDVYSPDFDYVPLGVLPLNCIRSKHYHIESLVHKTNKSANTQISGVVSVFVSAHSLGVNMQPYKTFDSMISIKSHVKGQTTLVSCCLLKKKWKPRQQEKHIKGGTFLWRDISCCSVILDSVRFRL